MREEFSLDHLPEHALVEVEADTWVVHPAWRLIDKELKKVRNKVGHLCVPQAGLAGRCPERRGA